MEHEHPNNVSPYSGFYTPEDEFLHYPAPGHMPPYVAQQQTPSTPIDNLAQLSISQHPNHHHLQLQQLQQQQQPHYSQPITALGPPFSPPNQATGPYSIPTPPPRSPFQPVSPPISGSDLSGNEQIPYHSHSSSTNSPPPSRGASANQLVHRTPHPARYHPIGSPSPSPTGPDGSAGSGIRGTRARRRQQSNSASDNEEMGLAESLAANRKEVTRKQRIEAEQRRRDDLRDGYAKLKDALPSSNAKSSKVSLLDRATTYISQLEATTAQLRQRVIAMEAEVQRLRSVNETLMLSVAAPMQPLQQHTTPTLAHPQGPPQPGGPPPSAPPQSQQGGPPQGFNPHVVPGPHHQSQHGQQPSLPAHHMHPHPASRPPSSPPGVDHSEGGTQPTMMMKPGDSPAY